MNIFRRKANTIEKQTHLLKFTGNCSEEQFNLKCSEHDFWYHSFYFDNGFSQKGDYDIGRNIDAYKFPVDMSGMKVLDLGTGSGWFATYFEQLGAEVTTVDARGYSDFDVWGRPFYPEIVNEKSQPDRIIDDKPIYYSPVSKGFWMMKDILGLKAKYVNSRIYDLTPELFNGEKFDLVFMGALLMHVRDPIGALMAARRVCKGKMITNSLKSNNDGESVPPVMEFLNSPTDSINWWRPNKRCLSMITEAAGFSKVKIEHTVDITTDKVFADKYGRSSGVTQTLYLVEAEV